MPTDDDHSNHYEIHQTEVYAIVIGIISTLVPFSVVFILLYKYDKLVRGKTLTHYILMIAISDTISAVTTAFGYPPSHSAACYAQGFLSIFFGRLSIFFTDVLVIQLLFVIVYRRFLFNISTMHMIVWPLNITLQIVPYTVNAIYGRGIDRPINRCFVDDPHSRDTGLLLNNWLMNYWLLLSFFIVAFCTLYIMGYSYYVIYIQPSNYVLIDLINDIRSTVIYYPIAMLFAFVPSACKFILMIIFINRHYYYFIMT